MGNAYEIYALRYATMTPRTPSMNFLAPDPHDTTAQDLRLEASLARERDEAALDRAHAADALLDDADHVVGHMAEAQQQETNGHQHDREADQGPPEGAGGELEPDDVGDVAQQERAEPGHEPLLVEHEEDVAGQREHQADHHPRADGGIDGIERDRHADEQGEGGGLGGVADVLPLRPRGPPVAERADQGGGQQDPGGCGHGVGRVVGIGAG